MTVNLTHASLSPATSAVCLPVRPLSSLHLTSALTVTVVLSLAASLSLRHAVCAMVSVLGSPILHLFSPLSTIRTLHDATTDLDGLTADCASEADSKEYYNSLNQHEGEEEAELGDTAAGLVDAYCASPPSNRWKQQREKQRGSREAEADEKVEEDDEEQTRAMLEELQTAHDERPAMADKHSTSSEKMSKRQMAATNVVTATRAARGIDTQSAEPAAGVGKHVTSSMLATTSSSSRQSKQAAVKSNKGGKQTQKAYASDELAEDGAVQMKEQKEEEEKAARKSTRRTVEPKQPMAAADGADLFDFGGADASETDKNEGRQQGLSAKKGKKAVAAARGSKKGAKQKAVSGRAKQTKKVTAEEQTEQFVTDTAALNEFDGKSVRQNTRRALPALSTARKAPAKASAERNSAAAEGEEQLEQDSHVFSFPSAADEKKKKKGHATTTAASKKQASAGRKKGKASQQKDDEHSELPAEGEAVLDEMVDGDDTALGGTAVSLTAHLDGYTASPPSAGWQKKRAGERLREIDQRAQRDDRTEDLDGQPQADTNGDGSKQTTEVEQQAVEAGGGR